MELFIIGSLLGVGIIIFSAIAENKSLRRKSEDTVNALDLIDDSIENNELNDKELIWSKCDISLLIRRHPWNSYEREYGRILISKIDTLLRESLNKK